MLKQLYVTAKSMFLILQVFTRWCNLYLSKRGFKIGHDLLIGSLTGSQLTVSQELWMMAFCCTNFARFYLDQSFQCTSLDSPPVIYLGICVFATSKYKK
jgi:hypothetical protein